MRLSIDVHADRSTEYDWEPVTSDYPPTLRLIPGGDSAPIGELDPTSALAELFRVFTYQRDWLRRELALAFGRNEIVDPPRREWASLVLEIKWSMSAATLDNDSKFAAWIKRYSARDKRMRARKRFADSSTDFAKIHGPLDNKLDSATFGSRVSDLGVLVQEVAGLRAEEDNDELRYIGDWKVARARAAASQVTDGFGTNERVSPDLFSALAYAVEHSRDFGVRYRICENQKCERLFVLPRTTKQWCSDACKMDAHRRKRA